jgi:hypothetical protein
MNNTDITTAIHNRFRHLDMTGISATTDGEGANWGYVICGDNGFILEGVADTLTSAVYRATATTTALRNRGDVDVSAHIRPSR